MTPEQQRDRIRRAVADYWRAVRSGDALRIIAAYSILTLEHYALILGGEDDDA